MKKIISVLSFAFIAAAMVNFIGVSYFKQTNIASFKNYSIFYGNNINKFDALLNNEKTSKETKEKMFMNPRTKKLERLTAGKKILFRQGKILKKKIND